MALVLGIQIFNRSGSFLEFWRAEDRLAVPSVTVQATDTGTGKLTSLDFLQVVLRLVIVVDTPLLVIEGRTLIRLIDNLLVESDFIDSCAVTLELADRECEPCQAILAIVQHILIARVFPVLATSLFSWQIFPTKCEMWLLGVVG